MEYFQSPGLPRQYVLQALDAEAGEDRKAFYFIFINHCKKEHAYSVHTDRSGRGGAWVGEGEKPTVELGGFIVCAFL